MCKEFKKFKVIARKTKLKDPNAPKRPLTAYFRFTKCFRLKNPGLSVPELGKEAAKAWKLLGVDEKKSFIDETNEEKKKYAVLLEKYKKSPG